MRRATGAPAYPFGVHDFRGRDAVCGAAHFAASRVKSGVKGRVTGEGGATPLISRVLDPRLTARAGPLEGSLPPRRHGTARSRTGNFYRCGSTTVTIQDSMWRTLSSRQCEPIRHGDHQESRSPSKSATCRTAGDVMHVKHATRSDDSRPN
jgi:hypothetical protein